MEWSGHRSCKTMPEPCSATECIRMVIGYVCDDFGAARSLNGKVFRRIVIFSVFKWWVLR